MNTLKQGGAAISARARTPSVDLATLADLLAKCVAPDAPPTGTRAGDLPLLVVDPSSRKLRVNTRVVLVRLFAHPRFKEAFSPSADTGFIHDLDLPPIRMTARTGGRLVPGSEAATTKSVEALRAAIARAVDLACRDVDLRVVVDPDAARALDRMAQRLDVRIPQTPASATVVPVAFVPSDRPVAERSSDVARILSAVEVVEGRDWLEKMLAGVSRKLESENLAREEIDDILEMIRLQRDQSGTQMRRFLDFLDDDALARVRLQVGFDLMHAVGEEASAPGLNAYVLRVRECFEAFGGMRGAALPLTVEKEFGARANGDLGDHLRKALFYKVLPVWPEGSAQLFEARAEGADGFATRREVTYRFRINGQNPQTGKSAFASRIDRLEQVLSEPPTSPWTVQRHVAEAVFLRLVVPDTAEGRFAEGVQEHARRLTSDLRDHPRGALHRVIADLRSRQLVMERLGDELVRQLRTRSRRIVDIVNRSARRYFVTVQRGIVDWPAVVSTSRGAADILVRGERGNDSAAWFKHLVINDDPAGVPGALASHSVETTLFERCLAPAGEKLTLSMRRDTNRPFLPVRFTPFRLEKTPSEATWTAHDNFHSTFDVDCGIDIEYDVRSLARKKGAENADKPIYEQWRAAGCAAFALIVYMVLWEVVRRLKATHGMDSLSAVMLRLQPGAREALSSDGNAALYAISQAVERALCRELPVKLQGFHTQGTKDSSHWRKKGALWALRSGFPLRIALDGGAPLESVAVLSYVTRPCDEHPLHLDADGYLYISRTYFAEIADGALHLRVESMRSRLVGSRESFKEPQLILEEIARLRTAGHRHVMLLSHHYRNQRVGRAAERHAPHTSVRFLEQAVSRFPDTFIYPLRRDIFPATRLRRHVADGSGFEAVGFDEHRAMLEGQRHVLDEHRHVVPIYTFATLAVVGHEDDRPQSGFCTYFLDDEHRLASEQSERARQNILGFGDHRRTREALISVLRSLHYLESEKLPGRAHVVPVLDPFAWAIPDATGAAGELEVMERRAKGNVLLSFPALLAHVTKILHQKESEEWTS